MKRKWLLLCTFLLSAALTHAQLVPLGKGALSTAGKNALRQRVQEAVLQQTQRQFFNNLANSSHTAFYALPDNTLRFVPKINSATRADVFRLEVAKEVLWSRITLDEQRELARLTQVPAHITQRVSPSLVQISLPGHSASEFTANGFIVNYNGTNWIALSYHVGGSIGNMRYVKMLLKDGKEVGFLGQVAVAGNAGYHEADISLIRVPDQWQDQVTPLEIGPVNPDLPVYSFGSVAENSGHDDFIPVKREMLRRNGTSIQMTHAMPGDDPLIPAGISGYCGSPIVQEEDGQLRVVGIFTGHVNPVSVKYPAISFAIDVNTVLPILMDNPDYTRPLKFLGYTIADLPLNARLDRMVLWRHIPNGKYIVDERELYHFPNAFSYENSERAFFDLEMRSGDMVDFIIKQKGEFSKITFSVP